MRLSRLALVSLVLFSITVPAVVLAAGDGAQGLDATWKKAMLAGDLDAVVACYAGDAVMWAPEAAEARGHDAIRAAYVGMLEGMKVTDISLTDTHYETSGDLAAGWGIATITMVPVDGGDAMTFTARFTSVAKKLEGRWVYVVDHISHPDEEDDDDGED